MTHRRFWFLGGLLVCMLILVGWDGDCNSADRREQQRVRDQQGHYLDTQPPPYFGDP